MSRGGRRAGAGRKSIPPELRRINVVASLPGWLARWLEELPWTQSSVIERALIDLRPRLKLQQEPDAHEALCEDCPPPDYPTDKTRCAPCPRRPAAQEASLTTTKGETP